MKGDVQNDIPTPNSQSVHLTARSSKWKTRGRIVINSVTDALSWLKTQAPNNDLWFRGQPQTWTPEPSLVRRAVVRALRIAEAQVWTRLWGPQYRVENYKESDPRLVVSAERRLNYEFVRETRPFLNGQMSNADLYFLAQHYRLPTRLLDWTTQLFTALFFAVFDDHGDYSEADGILYALDPVHSFDVVFDEPVGQDDVDLRTMSGPLTPADEVLVRLIDQSFSGETMGRFDENRDRSALAEVSAPIPVAPNLAGGRMFAQGSRFTLHPFGCPAFGKGVLRFVRIPAQRKPDIKVELHRLGVTYVAIFPEIESAVRDIKVRWLL